MSDPSLIRRELDRRLEEHLHSSAVTSGRSHLQQELGRTVSAMKRLLVAYEADLMSLDQLRRRMPELRRREKILTDEIESLDNHLTNQETYLKLAENLESFLARLRDAATNSSIRERQQVLRLVVREILVDSDSVVIRHTIPGLNPRGTPSCHLWGVSRGSHPSSKSHWQNPGLPWPAFPRSANLSRGRGSRLEVLMGH
jgi:site-specific DNA recombinase